MNSLAENIREQAEKVYPELVDIRRELHRDPELSWQEFRTTEKIITFLKSRQYQNIRRPLETGAVADLMLHPGKPFVALRADIDALPIADEKQVEYRSRNAGVCHACGHDIHTAVVLGTAAVLKQMDAKPAVNVRFIFQPAEEPIPSGALKLLEKAVLENVQSVWGLHVEPSLAAGTVSLTEGWVNAQSIKLRWDIRGAGGHSARPHLAQDPLWAGTSLIQQLYQHAYRRWTSPEQPVILSFTSFQSGETYNAIPRRAEIQATLRLTNAGLRESILSEIRKVNSQLQENTGLSIDFSSVAGAPPVMNDPAIIRRFRENLETDENDYLAADHNFRSMGGDDFGWYSRQVPSALIRLGTARQNAAPLLHTGIFDAPEEVIKHGLYFFILQLLRWPSGK